MRPGNIKDDIARLNRAPPRHIPRCSDSRNLRFLDADDDNVLFYAKTAGPTIRVLVAVNARSRSRPSRRPAASCRSAALGVAPR